MITTTTLTTIYGGLAAVAAALATYFTQGFDLKNPVWWCGMIAAAALALKSYYTQGIPASPPPKG